MSAQSISSPEVQEDRTDSICTTRRKSRIGGRKKGRRRSKSSHSKGTKGKKRAQEGGRDVGVLLLVRLPWGKQRSPLDLGASVLLGLSSLLLVDNSQLSTHSW